MPEHQAGAGFILDREQIQVFADAAMIPAQGLFLAAFVLGQLFRGFPSRAVDPLQLGFGFITTPVGPRHALQLKSLGVELAGVLHVGAGAEVPPVLSKGVKGDRFLEAFQDLQLVGLVLGLDLGFRLSARHLDTLERDLLIDDLDHPLLDRLEIGFGEGVGVVEVVVEAGFSPGADGDAGFGEELLHRHGHHMAHRVADSEQLRAFAGFGQDHRS